MTEHLMQFMHVILQVCATLAPCFLLFLATIGGFLLLLADHTFLNILVNRKNYKTEERRSVGTLSRVHGDEKVCIVERWPNVKERQDIRDSEYAKTHCVTYFNLGGFNNRLGSLELAFLFVNDMKCQSKSDQCDTSYPFFLCLCLIESDGLVPFWLKL